MKLPREFAGMQFALIEDTHERPPGNKIVTSCDTWYELKDLVCIAIFGAKVKDLPERHRDEFASYMATLTDEGCLSFEGDPGLSIGLYNPPFERDRPIEKNWLIQDCRQAVGNCALWWGPNRQGYVCSIEEAGRYTEKEAKEQEQSRSTDRAVRLEDALKAATRHVRTDTNGGAFGLKPGPGRSVQRKMNAARARRLEAQQ